MIMKTLFKIVLLVTLFFGVTSCEDLLTEKPANFYSTENFFNSTDKLRMAVNSVYTTFSCQMTYGQYWMVYDCDTDISFIQGTNLGHVARDLGHYNVYVAHAWLQESWQAYYEGIDRANTILEYRDNVEIVDEADQKVFDQLIAETHCLRAMCYFDLVLLFGDVPLKTEASKAEHDFNIPRTDRNKVFDQMEEDFKAAINGMEYAVDQSIEFKGRLNKGAAMGLLARMNLFRAGYFLNQKGVMERYPNYKAYYQNVIDITDQLIASNKHALLPNYERVFRNMCELIVDPTENIWEIPFFNPVGNKHNSSMIGTYNGPAIGQQSSYGRANSFIKTHNFFYDTYEENDLRKDVAVATFNISNEDEVRPIAVNQSYNWAPGKWRRNWQTGQVKDNNNTDVNWLFIRYADVLLMRAEAENEVNGVTPAAVEYLNQVRRRAFGFDYRSPEPSVDLVVSDFINPDEFRNEIVDERARELCFEGLRRQDLIRWNLLGTKLQETGEKIKNAISQNKLNRFQFVAAERFVPGKHELYPIPDHEVRETNGIITQNPNYSE
jgi:hypothetical protein